MTVRDLMKILDKYPPNMSAFTYNAKGEMVETDIAEILPGDDEVWHEKQGEDVVLIS